MKKGSKKRSTSHAPETDSEFLSAGVSLEEAGEKWQVGDPAKGSRLFLKAISMYNEGLHAFPNDFDLQYNKARIQYHLTQRLSLLAQSSTPLSELLTEALHSHRRALAIDSHNPDVLFNTAQVLCSLAEAVSHDETTSRRYHEEAIELFAHCLSRQETLYAESQILIAKGTSASLRPEKGDEGEGSGGGSDGGDGASLRTIAPDSRHEVSEVLEEPEQWASIVEPITAITMTETCVAALDSLTSLCSLSSTLSMTMLEQIRSQSQALLQKMSAFLEGVEDMAIRDEARCADLNFQCSYSDAQFHSSFIDAEQYIEGLKEALDKAHTGLETSNLLCCIADGHISLAVALSYIPKSSITRWTNLTKALEILNRATKLADQKSLPSIHISRGDVELSRLTLCRQGDLPDNLSNSSVRNTLVNNAGTYFRGALTTAEALSDCVHIARAALVKQAITLCLGSGTQEAIVQLVDKEVAYKDYVRQILRELVDESLVSEAMLRDCGLV